MQLPLQRWNKPQAGYLAYLTLVLELLDDFASYFRYLERKLGKLIKVSVEGM